MTRRGWFAACAGAATALAARPGLGDDPAPGGRPRLGIVEHSFSVRRAADRKRGGKDRIDDPIAFVNHCAGLGAGGVQMALGVRDRDYLGQLNRTLEEHGMFLEASIRLPQNPTYLDQFEAELKTAAESGARVVRTVLLGGRRYEVFTTAGQIREFFEHALRSLKRVVPVLGSGLPRLAVENHKDLRTKELVALLEQVDSPFVGACVDTGNSLALLEDPMETVEALAPWAYSTHLKDMAVEEDPDGFLLSEVPLGEGFLDIPRIVRVLRSAHPEVRLNLEMITRDPLKIPCLTPDYWATLDDIPGRTVARTLALVRRHAKKPLPRVSPLGDEEKLKAEDGNVRRCLDYAREQLGMS